MQKAVAGLLFCFSLAGCAPSAPLTRHELAEQVMVAVSACMPGALSFGIGLEGSTVNVLEQQLLLGASEVAVGNGVFATRDELDCIAHAGSDCDAVLACIGVTVEPIAACPHFDHRCVGHTVVFCTMVAGEPPLVVRQDCAAHGDICLEGGLSGTQQAQCASAICADDGTTCDGRTISTCIDGRRFDNVCTEGWVCDATAGTCVGAGPHCTINTCDGDLLLQCDPLSQRQTTPLDCGALGGHCDRSTGGCAAPESAECFFGEGTSCRDSVLEYCGFDGARHSYDCIAHGFASCRGDTCAVAD